MQNRLLLRVNETADLLGLSRSTIYHLVAEGRIPSVRLNRSVRIPLDLLKKWTDEQATGSGDDRE